MWLRSTCRRPPRPPRPPGPPAGSPPTVWQRPQLFFWYTCRPAARGPLPASAGPAPAPWPGFGPGPGPPGPAIAPGGPLGIGGGAFWTTGSVFLPDGQNTTARATPPPTTS